MNQTVVTAIKVLAIFLLLPVLYVVGYLIFWLGVYGLSAIWFVLIALLLSGVALIVWAMLDERLKETSIDQVPVIDEEIIVIDSPRV
jgi:hypothetical protein